MAYNVSYTSSNVPTFTNNSIGGLIAYQSYALTTDTSAPLVFFTKNVSPGAYTFNSIINFTNKTPLTTYTLTTILKTSTLTLSEAATVAPPGPAGVSTTALTNCHSFQLNIDSTIEFSLISLGGGTTNDTHISYSLMRIG